MRIRTLELTSRATQVEKTRPLKHITSSIIELSYL